MLRLSGAQKAVPANSDRSSTILLDGVDLEINAGETVAVLGRSGSGKSTLLNILGVLETLDAGAYTIDGLETSTLSDRQRSLLRSKTFGFVFQQYHLLNGRSVLQNVAAPLLFGTLPEVLHRRQTARRLIDEVGLSDRAHAHPGTMSGGEQQRAAIARSLIRNPRVILADEPTGSLDVACGELVLDLLHDQVARRRAALVLVTHDEMVAGRADRVLRLNAGALVPT